MLGFESLCRPRTQNAGEGVPFEDWSCHSQPLLGMSLYTTTVVAYRLFDTTGTVLVIRQFAVAQPWTKKNQAVKHAV